MTTLTTMRVSLVDLPARFASIRDEILQAVARVVDHGQFIFGPEVEALESAWAKRCDVRHAIGVADGTAALTLVQLALGAQSGDEILTPPNSFIASASSVALCGATPRFVDVGDDFNIDPDRLDDAITPRTRGIIAVHLTGRPAAIDDIRRVAERRGLWVIEDAAQAFGARSRGRPVGGLATAGCFSLHPLKTAGVCGDAGMVTTNDDALAERIRRLRNHGFDRRQEDCAEWGRNARLDTIQAAIGLVMLDHVDHWIDRRRASAAIYRHRLSNVVAIPPDDPRNRCVHQTFPIESDRRDELIDHLADRGIAAAVHYRTPIHLLKAARDLGYAPGAFPRAEGQANRMLSLPIHEGLVDEDIHRVCDGIEAFFR